MAKVPSPVFEVDHFWSWYELALKSGWTDGLVVAPPTLERVDHVISALGRRPDEVIGIVGPKEGVATIEQIAINCVMAGCDAEHGAAAFAARKKE
jgi:hypothetical protein